MMYLWVHPSAVDQTIDLLNRSNDLLPSNYPKLKISKSDSLIRYELFGPKSHAVLRSFLKLINNNNK